MATAARNNDIALFGIKGRWGTNSPFACPPDQCIEAVNVDWYRSTHSRKRNGASNVSLTGGTAQTGVVSFLFSHVPGADQTARELWSVDDAATPRFKRLTGGVAWADVTLKDNVATRPMDINACSFNGKLFFGYDTTVNRLQVWDPVDAVVRRTGLALPAAATVANTGAGTYAATLRYYKVAYAVLSGTTILRRSNLSASVSITPSGVGAAVRITKPASISESETHWLLYASTDDSNYVLIATTVVGTTTFDDSVAPASYPATGFAPDPNAFTPPPSCKYLVADDKYLVMAGNWETTAGDSMAPSPRRIWWSSALGSTDQGDDERISNTSTIKSYTDIAEAVTGLSNPHQGSIYVYSYNGIWKMVGTGVAAAPYVSFRITGAKGCIDHKTIVSAEDENGAAATYWMSPQGPCRLGAGGQFSLIEDISDIWDGVNIGATNVVSHGLYHRDKHQIWWWVATGASNDPDVKVVFDVSLGRVLEAGKIRRGWAKHTGNSAAARCSTMHSNTLGASMSKDLKPYIGRSTGTAIWKCDTGTTDAGTVFQSYTLSRPFTPAGLGQSAGISELMQLAAEAAAATTIRMSVVLDFGARTINAGDALLTATAAPNVPTRVFPLFQNSRVAMAKTLQFQIGDSAAVDSNWNLDACSIPNTPMGPN